MIDYRKNYVITDFSAMNDLIALYKKYNKISRYRLTPTLLEIEIDSENLKLQFSLTGSEIKKIDVPNISKAFKKYVTMPYIDKEQWGYKVNDDGKVTWNIKSIGGFAENDSYFVNKPLKCWSYDINSAFAYAMLKPMPDTSVQPRFNDLIKDHEIGFNYDGSVSTEIGVFAQIIFPLMQSPFTEYIYNYYNKKNKALNKEERRKWKNYLNIPTGLLQRYNIFLRNAVIYYSNNYIRKYIDENTVYCNVDSIVSLVPRTDLPLGNEIGQFKIEHQCENFKYSGRGRYQWGTDVHYIGIVKDTIKDIENIANWKSNIKYYVKDLQIYETQKND